MDCWISCFMFWNKKMRSFIDHFSISGYRYPEVKNVCEYLRENENILGCDSRDNILLIHEKNRFQKSHATVPLRHRPTWKEELLIRDNQIFKVLITSVLKSSWWRFYSPWRMDDTRLCSAPQQWRLSDKWILNQKMNKYFFTFYDGQITERLWKV